MPLASKAFGASRQLGGFSQNAGSLKRCLIQAFVKEPIFETRSRNRLDSKSCCRHKRLEDDFAIYQAQRSTVKIEEGANVSSLLGPAGQGLFSNR